MNLSVVLPCLNEEGTLAFCIEEIRTCFADKAGFSYEVLVADNGSTDRSCEIALAHGARVVDVPERGYGAALRGGIAAANGKHVIFADADGTYRLNDTWNLYEAAIANDADMAIASRIRGTIDPSAMPFLHRYLGTPVLTWIINKFFRGNVSDCNSGFRCIRKSAFQGWNVCSNGMEFASELIVKALKGGAKIVEVPSGLKQSPSQRIPHLRTWHDGMRHLLVILSERPKVFEWMGLVLVCLATLLQLGAQIIGPMKYFELNVFDIHSKALLLLAALVGSQLYLCSCMLFLRGRERPNRVTRALMKIDEAALLLVLLLGGAAIVGVIGVVGRLWMTQGFADIYVLPWLLGVIHFIGVPCLWIIGLLGIQIFTHTSDGRREFKCF